MEMKPIKAAGLILLICGIAAVVLGLWTEFVPKVFGMPTFTTAESFIWYSLSGLIIEIMTICMIIGAAMIIAGILLIIAVKNGK